MSGTRYSIGRRAPAALARSLLAAALVALAALLPASGAAAQAAPDIFLLSPFNGSEVGCTTVELRWTSMDPDGGPLSFVVELSDGAGFNLTKRTASRNLSLELPDRTSFDWRVTASGTKGNATSPFSRFVVHVDRGPVIHSVPVLEARPGRTYEYRVVATDPDADALTYRLVEGPGNMGMTPDGKVLWVPWSGQAGKTFKVAITVGDGVLEERQEFDVTVEKEKAPATLAGAGPSPWIAAGLAIVLALELFIIGYLRKR
jgi:hypothetical protein